jgi:hypothetical protein
MQYTAFLNPQVVKSAKDLIQRVARVMLEVDVLPGKNGFYVENNNKQVFQMIAPLHIQNSTQHFFYPFHIPIYALNRAQAEVEAYMISVGFKKVMWQVIPIFFFKGLIFVFG